MRRERPRLWWLYQDFGRSPGAAHQRVDQNLPHAVDMIADRCTGSRLVALSQNCDDVLVGWASARLPPARVDPWDEEADGSLKRRELAQSTARRVCHAGRRGTDHCLRKAVAEDGILPTAVCQLLGQAQHMRTERCELFSRPELG